MKYSIPWLFIFIFLFSFKPAYSQGEYKVIGQIDSSQNLDGKIIYMSFVDYSGKNDESPDSTIIKDSKFEFNGELKTHAVLSNLYLKEKESSNLFQFLMITGENKLMIHPPKYDFRNGKKLDYLSNTEPLTEDAVVYNRYMQAFNIYQDEMNWKQEKLSKNPNKNTDPSELFFEYYEKSLPYRLAVIEQNPDSYASVYLLLYQLFSQMDGKYDQLDLLYNKLSTKVKNTDDGKILAEKLNAVRELNDTSKIYNFSIADTDGKVVQLSDYKGKKVLLEFWASWCGPCIANLPKLKKYAAENPDVQILAISIDDKKENWLTAIKKHEFNYAKHVSELKGFAGDISKVIFNISYIPRAILIDEHGRIENLNFKLE